MVLLLPINVLDQIYSTYILQYIAYIRCLNDHISSTNSHLNFLLENIKYRFINSIINTT